MMSGAQSLAVGMWSHGDVGCEMGTWDSLRPGLNRRLVALLPQLDFDIYALAPVIEQPEGVGPLT